MAESFGWALGVTGRVNGISRSFEELLANACLKENDIESSLFHSKTDPFTLKKPSKRD